MIILNEREVLAYQLREKGLTYKEIGKKMGIGSQRARQIYQTAEWKMEKPPHWTDGLETSVINRLCDANINSRAEALSAYQSGRLRPESNGTKNYGWKSHKKLAKWLELPEPKKPERKPNNVKICPHCGGRLS